MAVYPRPDRNPFLEIDEIARQHFQAQRARHSTRHTFYDPMSTSAREPETFSGGPRGGGMSDAVIDLVFINGVWQVPPR